MPAVPAIDQPAVGSQLSHGRRPGALEIRREGVIVGRRLCVFACRGPQERAALVHRYVIQQKLSTRMLVQLDALNADSLDIPGGLRRTRSVRREFSCQLRDTCPEYRDAFRKRRAELSPVERDALRSGAKQSFEFAQKQSRRFSIEDPRDRQYVLIFFHRFGM